MISGMRLPTPSAAPLVALVALATLTACRGSSAAAPPAAQPSSRVAYAVAGDDTLFLHHFAPPAGDTTARRDRRPRPAVLLLHGGGWTAGDPSWVYGPAAAFAAAGFEAFAVQYRLSDSLTTPLEAIADACTAIRWTRLRADSLGVDAERVAVAGASAGGHLAASTVTVGCPAAIGERGADALLLLSPAVDVEADAQLERLLRGRAAARDVSPAANGRAGMPPTVLIQGAADSLTPLPGAQRFCLLVAAQRQPCDLRVYDGLGHMLSRSVADQRRALDPDPMAMADALRHQVQFLRRLWPTEPSPTP